MNRIGMALLLGCTITPLWAKDTDLDKASSALKNKQFAEAEQLATEFIEANPKNEDGYFLRAVARFKKGDMKASVADFEKVAELKPPVKPKLWQLGLAYYYAGEFAKGEKLFELHRTANPEDVENSAWHFLCKARVDGVNKARAALIPVSKDHRVPMKEILLLFGDKAKPADVLDAAAAGKPDANQLKRHLFYAHLYLGLYYEATGDAKRSAEEIRSALKHEIGDYMYDVAVIHQKLRQAEKSK